MVGILFVGGVVKGYFMFEVKKEILVRVGLDKDVLRIERFVDFIEVFVVVVLKWEELEIFDRLNSGEVEGVVVIFENLIKNFLEVKMVGQENV